MMIIKLTFVALLIVLAGAALTKITVQRPNPTVPVNYPAFIDCNNDGTTDILLHTGNSAGGAFHCLVNQGGYTFSAQPLHSFNVSFNVPFCAADLDGDSDTDIVYHVNHNTTHKRLFAFENKGSGSFTAHEISFSNSPNALACVDFDNDGVLDIISSELNTIVGHKGLGCFGKYNKHEIPNPAVDFFPSGFVVGKAPHLAYKNVVFAGSWTGQIRLIHYNGATLATTLIGDNYNAFSVGIADFNGDGVQDYVAAGMNCWNVNAYTNINGVYTRGNVAVTSSCFTRSFVKAGDLDGNGYGDIVLLAERTIYVQWNSQSGSSVTTLGTNLYGNSIVFDYPAYEIGRLYNNGLGNNDLVLVGPSGNLEIYTTCFNCSTCPADSFVNTAGVCTPCPANHKSVAGSTTCFPVCQAGLYGTYPECFECPPGTYATEPGAIACVSCPASQVTPGGNIPCYNCSQNSYPHGKSTCALCPLGSFAAEGSVSCTNCPAGSIRIDTDECEPCPPGYYVSGLQCFPCAPGTYNSVSGALSCSPCPAETYVSTPAATACSTCPDGLEPSSAHTYCY